MLERFEGTPEGGVESSAVPVHPPGYSSQLLRWLLLRYAQWRVGIALAFSKDLGCHTPEHSGSMDLCFGNSAFVWQRRRDHLDCVPCLHHNSCSFNYRANSSIARARCRDKLRSTSLGRVGVRFLFGPDYFRGLSRPHAPRPARFGELPLVRVHSCCLDIRFSGHSLSFH